jgi:hypothetical protein
MRTGSEITCQRSRIIAHRMASLIGCGKVSGRSACTACGCRGNATGRPARCVCVNDVREYARRIGDGVSAEDIGFTLFRINGNVDEL